MSNNLFVFTDAFTQKINTYHLLALVTYHNAKYALVQDGQATVWAHIKSETKNIVRFLPPLMVKLRRLDELAEIIPRMEYGYGEFAVDEDQNVIFMSAHLETFRCRNERCPESAIKLNLMAICAVFQIALFCRSPQWIAYCYDCSTLVAAGILFASIALLGYLPLRIKGGSVVEALFYPVFALLPFEIAVLLHTLDYCLGLVWIGLAAFSGPLLVLMIRRRNLLRKTKNILRSILAIHEDTVTAFHCAALIPVAVMAMWYYEGNPLIIPEPIIVEQIQSLDEREEDVRQYMVDLATWSIQTPEQRLNTLQSIADNETETLGIEPVEICTHYDPNPGLFGWYAEPDADNGIEHPTVFINTKLINGVIGNDDDSILCLCHEIRHEYQYRVHDSIEALSGVLPELVNLQYIQEVKEAADNLNGSYISAIDDFEAYQNQPSEKDACQYAQERLVFYKEFMN